MFSAWAKAIHTKSPRMGNRVMNFDQQKVLKLAKKPQKNMDAYFLLPALNYTQNQRLYKYLDMMESVSAKIVSTVLKHTYKTVYVDVSDVGFLGVSQQIISYLTQQLKCRGIICEVKPIYEEGVEIASDDALVVHFHPIGSVNLAHGRAQIKNKENLTPVLSFMLEDFSLSVSRHMRVVFLLEPDWQIDDDFIGQWDDASAIDSSGKLMPLQKTINLIEAREDTRFPFLPESKSIGIEITTAMEITYDGNYEFFKFSYLNGTFAYNNLSNAKTTTHGSYPLANESFTLYRLTRSEMARDIKGINETDPFVSLTYDADMSVLFISKKE
jgi:hypothetical protein